MRTASFDRVARSIVTATLASMASSCGGVDTEGMSLPACDADLGTFDLFAGVRLAQEADSLELASVSEGGTPQVVASRGTRCASATDPAACDAAVKAILEPAEDAPALEGFQLGQCVDFCEEFVVVVTRGDEVTMVRDVAGARALLGTIDTPTEAIWAVKLEQYYVACDPEKFGVREVDEGYEVAATRLTNGCEPVETTQYLLAVGSDAKVSVLDESVIESDSGCVGRRPACLRDDPGRGRSPIGARLAGLAQLEAASIPAFAILARELGQHGAPRSLRRDARRARADEVRHARTMRRHARRFGGTPQRPQAPALAARPLVDIAIENAREGCVREAYGAIVARYQARRAAEPALRRSLETIARDEAKHATLALRIDAWARRRLDENERGLVERARREAFEELRAQLLGDDPGPEVAAALGLPRPAEARLLLAAFEAAQAVAEVS